MIQTIKQALLMLLVILGGCLTGQRIYAQQYSVVGADICSDGSQSAHISLSDSDPAKFYALYRDGQFLEVKSRNSGKTPNVIDFGNFAEPGKYTVAEFPKTNTDYDKPAKGRKISGSVSINSLPLVYVPAKLEASFGIPINYQPKASIEGCTYKWTARLDAGSATGFKKSGAGFITDTIVVQGNQPACVMYFITPYSPEHLGSCMGNSKELVVWIKP